jgi:hypothetical protein
VPRLTLELRAAAFTCAAILVPAASAVEPQRPERVPLVTRAVFAEGRLWIRSHAGLVFSVAPSETKRREEPLPGEALDLCVSDGRVVALTSTGDAWTLRTHDGQHWKPETSIAAEGWFGVLDCKPHEIGVVTLEKVFLVRAGKTKSVKLSPPLPGWFVPSSVHIEGDHMFVGLNYGEFGGRLLRADLSTGLVTDIERRGRGLCGGPLNPDCDPIHAIAADPWKRECVVASIGLIHMMTHGRLTEICGDDVRTLASRRRKAARFGPGTDESEDHDTVAFFDVAPSGAVLFAIGVDGLYRVSRQSVEREPLPPFKDVDGIKVSFDVPGVVLVLADAYANRSEPFIIPRD